MFKGSKALTPGQVADYHDKQLTRNDYYSEGADTPGRWFGRGAEMLGLSGDVDREAWRRLADGQHPQTGETLVSADVSRGKHRAGWDFVYSASKDISLLATRDERIKALVERAVRQELAESFEIYAQARISGGRQDVTTGNLVGATFVHDEAREAKEGEGGRDPHLHVHSVVFNMTQRQDGAWRALQPRELFRSQHWMDVRITARVEHGLREIGYDTYRGEKGELLIRGIDETQRTEFSRRHHQIRRAVQSAEERMGQSVGPGLEERIQRDTRARKTTTDRDERDSEWAARMRQVGLDIERLRREAEERGPIAPSQEKGFRVAEEGVRYSVQHTTEREAVVDRRDLEFHALRRAGSAGHPENVAAAIARERGRGNLIEARSPSPGQAYTTRELVQIETENIRTMKAGQGKAVAFSGEAVARWAQARDFTPDQAEALKKLLSTPDRYVALEGKPGATKTTTVRAVREFFEERGFRVLGFGPTTGARDALRDAGIPAETTQKLASSTPKPGGGRRDIWVADESSMHDARLMRAVQERAKLAGVERVILVGDSRQHYPIGAGRPADQLRAAGMQTANLDVIRRQLNNPELRRAVELAHSWHTRESVHKLEAMGAVREIPDDKDRARAIAKDFADAYQKGEHVIAVAPSRAERKELNETIRAELVERGRVKRQEVEVQVKVPKDMTRAERTHANAYEAGDRVRYRQGSHANGIGRGTEARVVRVDAAQNQVTVQKPDGKEVTYDPRRLRGVEVYRDESRQFAQGDRIAWTAPEKERAIANGQRGTLEKLDAASGRATVRLDSADGPGGGRKVEVDLSKPCTIDHGYASTGRKAQGTTVDRVYANVRTDHSDKLVNRRQYVVDISRARLETRIYTDDRGRLPEAVSRDPGKATARESVLPERNRLERDAGRRPESIRAEHGQRPSGEAAGTKTETLREGADAPNRGR